MMSQESDLDLLGYDFPLELDPFKWSSQSNDIYDQYSLSGGSVVYDNNVAGVANSFLSLSRYGLQSDDVANSLGDFESYGSQLSISSAAPTDYRSPASDNAQALLVHDALPLECFGMIYRLNVKLVGNMSKVLTTLAQTESPCANHWILHVELQDDTELIRPNLFARVASQGLAVAQFNLHASEALAYLLKRGIKFEALAHKTTLNNAVLGSRTASDATTTVNVNVYGSAQDRSSVGQYLSKSKLWLQRPVWRQPDTIYENPHTIKLESWMAEDPITKIEPEDAYSPTENLELFRDGVYASLTRDSLLQGLAGDSHLRTPLLPHQEKALEFMIQRESGNVPEVFRLWRKNPTSSDSCFEHEITHNKSTLQPDEGGGGIIADEMGMGKSYSTLALIMRTLPQARQWIGAPDTLSVDEIPFSMRLSKATLIVVPSRLLLATWQAELLSRVDMTLKVLIYHGVDRTRQLTVLADQDIVLTTYHTLLADHKTREAPLAKIWWYRLVLDEAHFIRRPTSHLHRKVGELSAKYRWCLTGTPIQNSLDDVGALIAFLNIPPFDRVGVFRKYISVLYQQGGNRKALAQHNLARLLDAVCLRRTKQHLNLLPTTEEVHTVLFSEEEQAQYDATKHDLKSALDQAAGSSAFSRKFGLLQAHLQLRLLCNHGTYQRPFGGDILGSLEVQAPSLRHLREEDDATCAVCAQPAPRLLMSELSMVPWSCSHILCLSCEGENDGDCPVCKSQAAPTGQTKVMSKAKQFRMNQLRAVGYSSKIETLIWDLTQCMQTEKCLVFSTWTTSLDLIGSRLEYYGISFERIDGEHSFEHRERVLSQFETDLNLRIIIMTTGVGAFGLNIIAASRVFLFEPQWNPSVEAQAIGRTQRIGQDKAVVVTRYIVDGTVEQDIRNLQHNKRNLARNAKGSHW